MDENGYRFKLTTNFDDGDSIVEFYKTKRGLEAAKKMWTEGIEADREKGMISFSITSFEVEAL